MKDPIKQQSANTIYYGIVAIGVVTLLCIVVTAIFAPTQTAILGTVIIGFASTLISQLFTASKTDKKIEVAGEKVQELERQINSRMDQHIEIIKDVAHRAGVQQEKDDVKALDIKLHENAQ